MKQLSFAETNGWGGKRRGAGRPSRTGQPGHARRAKVKLELPVHITMRLKALPVSLRSRASFAKFKASAARAKTFGLHINQFALLGNHLHMIAEARDNTRLTRGMRSFGGSLGKMLRRAVGGRGSVFAGRFHLQVLKTPRQYRNALRYVLLNRSRHAGEIAAPDDFSSGPYFREWRRLLGDLTHTLLEGRDRNPARCTPEITPARSWLGRVGWRRAK